MWIDKADWQKALETVLHGDFDVWTWCRNSDCKYINVRIDTRDGAAWITDNNDKEIALDDLLFQHRSDGSVKGNQNAD